jgi:hypothetical protein
MSRIWEPAEDQKSAWLIYALGGGWGHLNRAVALGRIAAQQRPVSILTNSPYAGVVSAYLHRQSQRESVPHLHIIAPETKAQMVRDRVRQVLLSADYSCLIVDTFPRGLGGELVDILPHLSAVPRILIHRNINPQYVQAKNLRAFVSDWYDAVIIPGEGEDLPLADLPHAIHTLPWVVCQAMELASKRRSHGSTCNPTQCNPTHGSICDSTHDRLMNAETCANPLPPEAESYKTLLVCAAGQPSEQAFLGSLTRQLTEQFVECDVYCLAAQPPPHCPDRQWITHYPGMEVLATADIVIGGAGYNTVYECAALKVPLISFAFSRLYDCQMHRAQRLAHRVNTPQESIAMVQKLLQNPDQASKSHLMYCNGAIDAVNYINQISQG